MEEVSQEELLRRCDQVDDERLIPEPAMVWLKRQWTAPMVRLWRVELVIENLIQKVPNMPAEMLAAVCEILAPELYGEPPAPPRASHALPKSRARLAALQRRHLALHSLWHRDDSFVDGVTARQQELFLYSEIIEAGEKIEQPKGDIIRINSSDIG